MAGECAWFLDGVFNHTGRDFWAFRDVLTNGESSSFRDWFHNLQFGHKSPYGDPFTYTGWDQHYDLVKLNLKNREVREHLFSAIDLWVDEFEIDGIRLDAADVLDLNFLHELRVHCDEKKPDFWLMGEVVQGDYRKWMNADHLHSVTNYECYKGSYSSLVDKNYFEIAYSLNRLFGKEGMYRGENLYNFADNHDVNRIASMLPDPRLLFPLYILLFCMPGIPSIYYGSEWGSAREEGPAGVMTALRPALDIRTAAQNAPQPHLADTIRRLAQIRKSHVSLQAGDYRQLMVAHLQFVFCRTYADDTILVCLNADSNPAQITIPVSQEQTGLWQDELDPAYRIEIRGLTESSGSASLLGANLEENWLSDGADKFLDRWEGKW